MSDAQYTLVAVETVSIQPYIFTSNRLRENVGASYLVAVATGDWAFDSVDKAVGGTNHNIERQVDKLPRWRIKTADLRIERDNLSAEVVYSGGGNFFVLFKTADFAKKFVRALSQRAHIDAPGLALTFVQRTVNWENNPLSEDIAHMLTHELSAARSQQPNLPAGVGQGINIMCSSTTKPAVSMHRDAQDGTWRPISAEVMAKLEHEAEANAYLESLLDLHDLKFQDASLSYEDFTLSRQLDKLGRSEGISSYIGVVHADGNDLGLLIKGLKDTFDTPQSNRAYINYMRDFSAHIKNMNKQAQKAIFQQIANSIVVEEYDRQQKLFIYGLSKTGEKNSKQKIELNQQGDDGKWVFPIRPLISGGDDITFVCDGRISIDLATAFLREFEAHSQTEIAGLKKKHEKVTIELDKLTACAGIAIVKAHYPFARAYDLADDLAGNAKQERFVSGMDVSVFDWHITAGGLYGDLEEIREREYRVEDGYLTLRPIFLNDFAREHPLFHKSWQITQNIITEFQRYWSDSRNKAEGLRAVLRKGSVETAIYKARYLSDAQSPDLPVVGGFETNGWYGGYCGYYDALELMDKYIPLTQKEAIR